MTVPPPVEFGVCPKCGSPDIGVLYRENPQENYSCRQHWEVGGEHFDVNCRRCQHKWAATMKGVRV